MEDSLKFIRYLFDLNPNPYDLLVVCINNKCMKKKERNIWKNSKYEKIDDLCCDDVGKLGEDLIIKLCNSSDINAEIDGLKFKNQNIGDGKINGKTVEIKTARSGSGKASSFQHELSEKPWITDYIIFIDISPEIYYITILLK